MSHVPAFPKDFLWGSSISGGQCEGGYATRGATVVDPIPQGRGARFAWMRNPSPVLEGGQGICLNPNGTDFYGHWKEDIALLADAGVRALRFSVLWSRIFPDDREEPSAEGLAFYSNVIDELLAHDIVPVITTIHFDMPLWVALRHDGFATREGLERYERFVDAIVAAYADRVKYWISYCELNNIDFIPFVVAGVADDGSPEAAQRIKRAEWHLLLGNAYLVRACHAADPSIMVGCEFGFSPTYTLSPSPACYAQKLREDGDTFLNVTREFTEFLGDSVMMTWGTTDLFTLMENYRYYKHDGHIPFLSRYCDAQEYCEKAMGRYDEGNQIG